MSSQKLLLATRNQHKKQEIQAILENENITLLTLDDIGPMETIEEDGTTFAENAEKKARLTAIASGFMCLADDSGLTVEALGGQPGVYSARFAGEQATDAANNQKLLTLLQEVEAEKRQAEFICVITISDPQGRTSSVQGTCPGHITDRPAGENGFGYDPLFIPTGYTKTFAELDEKEKNRISHRAQALRKARSLFIQQGILQNT